ncbi:LysR family transcriptional regulator [Vibrio chagasii]|uniref:LysR family transcriptional regulator n=1 Tax=Vibrio chagasii TaxID=170679 RepID=UPI003735CF84
MGRALRDLIVFEEVCLCENYREVASNLGISLTAVSRAIKSLEVDCGEKLFFDNGNSLELTFFGKSLLDNIQGLNNDMHTKYDAFVKQNRHVNILTPQQLSGNMFVNYMRHFNSENKCELSISQITDIESRDKAYDMLGRGGIDFMIDVQPCMSNRFICDMIYSTEVYLVGNREHYNVLSGIDINDGVKFAKSSWLGKKGEMLERVLGIKSDSQIGFVTQDLNSYYDVISSTSLIGLCPQEFLVQSDKFVFSEMPICKLELYFIATKGAMKHKAVVKWFREYLLRDEICLGNMLKIL